MYHATYVYSSHLCRLRLLSGTVKKINWIAMQEQWIWHTLCGIWDSIWSIVSCSHSWLCSLLSHFLAPTTSWPVLVPELVSVIFRLQKQVKNGCSQCFQFKFIVYVQNWKAHNVYIVKGQVGLCSHTIVTFCNV